MKKYILSFLLIGTVGLYSLYQRSGVSSDVAILSINTTIPITKSSDPIKVIPPPKKLPTPTPVLTPVLKSAGQYVDGIYTGINADAYYGNIQVQATISGGKLIDVQFLDYPQDRRTSIQINTQAMPYLQSEAIRAQSANVNTISGATDSSGAFRQSLGSALAQAKNN